MWTRIDPDDPSSLPNDPYKPVLFAYRLDDDRKWAFSWVQNFVDVNVELFGVTDVYWMSIPEPPRKDQRGSE